MEFFHLIKATQKSGKPDAVHWQTHKTEARANLALDVALEDAEIVTGRGQDYNKPVRTDFPVFDDLPEEGAVDFEWCKRYELADDLRTWKVKLLTENSAPATPGKNDELPGKIGNRVVEKEELLRPIARLRLPQRIIAHLINDTELKDISEEQHIQIGQMENDESSHFVQNLLLAVANEPGIKELSAHVEWKLVSAIKTVFAPDKVYAVETLEEFINEWINEPETRALSVRKWAYDNKPVEIKGEMPQETSPAHVREEIYADDDSVKFQLATMPFRIQLLAQLNANDRHVYHISIPERKELSALEMDMDNSYVQSLLLAVENTSEVKAYDMPTLWKLTDAIKKVFPQGKRHELNLFIQFTKTWIRTEHIDRGILTREWAAGNRITDVNRTQSGANAGGVIHSDRLTPQTSMGQEYEISLGLIARRCEFDIYNPPLEVDAEANAIMNLTVSGSGDTLDEFLATRELFSSIPGGMDYSRACNVATVKTTPENLWRDRVKHREYLNRVMAETDHAHPDQLIVDIACGRSSMPIPMAGKSEPSNESVSQQMEATNIVQMEEMGGNEVKNGTPIQESADATGAVQGADETCVITDKVDIDTGHHNGDAAPVRLFTHLMLDLETMGKKPGAPIVSIGAVFFDPATGETGGEFYRVVSLESSMNFGARPDAGTILWWLKQSPEARSAILVDDALGLVEALEQFSGFIAENASNGSKRVQLWGNGSSFDCSITEAAFELADCPFPIPHWNYRDVRTVVEMGNAVGMNSRYEIPFEGDQHNALADARHQVKYLSAIWQRLISN
jgi:exodeoxyribonuclease VIII